MQCKVPISHHNNHAVFTRTPAARNYPAVTEQVPPGEPTPPYLNHRGQSEVQWLPTSLTAPIGARDSKETRTS